MRERHPVARADPHRRQRIRDAIGFALQFRERHGAGFAALAFPKAGDAIRCGPSIQAVVRDIEFAADEPLRPFGPARSVEHLRIRLKPLDIHFAHDFIPETLGLFPRKAQECLAVVETQALHEAPDVGLLDEFAGGLPDHAINSVTRAAMR